MMSAYLLSTMQILSDLKRMIQSRLYSEKKFMKEYPLNSKMDSQIREWFEVVWTKHAWAAIAIASAPTAYAKVVDSDWSIDVTTHADVIEQIMVPAARIELTVQDPPVSTTTVIRPRTIPFELNRTSLNMMVDELSKIKQHLKSFN